MDVGSFTFVKRMTTETSHHGYPGVSSNTTSIDSMDKPLAYWILLSLGGTTLACLVFIFSFAAFLKCVCKNSTEKKDLTGKDFGQRHADAGYIYWDIPRGRRSTFSETTDLSLSPLVVNQPLNTINIHAYSSLWNDDYDDGLSCKYV